MTDDAFRRGRPCPTASGKASSSSTRRPPRSTATSATPTASRTRRRRVVPRTATLMARTAAEAAAIPVEGLSTEERITRDMLQVIGELGVEEDDQGLHQLRVVDQMGGPQQLLPQLTASSSRSTPPSGSRRSSRGCTPIPRSWPPTPTSCARRSASGLTAPSIVTERDDRPDRADARDPDRGGDRARRASRGPSDADRERIREVVRDDDLSGRRGVPRDAPRRVPPRQPRGAGHLVGAQRRGHLSDRDPELDDARDGPAARSTRSGWTSSRRSTTSAARSPGAAGLRRRHRPPIARRSTTHRATPRDRRTSWSSAPPRTSIARWRRRRATSGVLPKAGLDVRPVEEYKEKDAPFAYYYPPSADGSTRRHLLRERLRPPVAQVHEARLDDLPRGRARPPLPDRARDGEPAT